MPNWCSTAYAIEGDAKEIKSLYKLMKGLQERKEPSVENGFGTTWLGCLVDALGKDWHTVHCRGSWSCLELEDDVLKFFTETAWSPCNETFELVQRKSRVWKSTRPTMKTGHISATGISWMPVLRTENTSANISRNRRMCSNGLKKNLACP